MVIGRDNAVTGSGIWQVDAATGAFTFAALHPISDTADQRHGRLGAGGASFASSGTTRVYAAPFEPVSAPAAVTMTGTRVD